jgi:ketosteroid isomerase-like protein
MGAIAMTRRRLLGAGACALAAGAGIPEIAGARAQAGLSAQNEALIRKYYQGWEIKDWPAFDAMLTDDFTFSSPFDARISKSAFKKGCWDTQVALIAHFDLEHVAGTGNDAFVMYTCHTTTGKTFRNVEYFQLRDGKVADVECYFGGGKGYPSAVNGQK